MAHRFRKDKAAQARPWESYWRNPFTGKREAARHATEAEAVAHSEMVLWRLKHDRESFRPANNPRPADLLTVGEAVGHYIRERFRAGVLDVAAGRKTTRAAMNLRATWKHLHAILPHLDQVPARELTRRHMREAVAARTAAGVGQTTISREISIIKAALSWAVNEAELLGEDAVNPIEGFRCPRGHRKKLPPPSAPEVRAILKVAPPHLARAIVLAWHTGARPGRSELLDMRWSDFALDADPGLVRLRSAAKNPDMPYRELMIPGHLLPRLRAWRAGDEAQGIEHVIHWRGRPVGCLRTAWNNAVTAAKIGRRLRLYDLRHAYYNEAMRACGDDKATATAMGQSGERTGREHYRYVRTAELDRIQEGIPALLDEDPEGHTGRAHEKADSGRFLCDPGKLLQ